MNKKKITEQWIRNNGACKFDLKEKTIKLYDGGLFSIESEKIKVAKRMWLKQLPDGNTQCIFSKKRKTILSYYATLWISELDETINYLKRMKRMLNKIGYRTGVKCLKTQK